MVTKEKEYGSKIRELSGLTVEAPRSTLVILNQPQVKLNDFDIENPLFVSYIHIK